MHFTAAVTAQRSLSYTFNILYIPHILSYINMLCQCFLFTLYILKKNKPNHPSPGNTELSHPLVTGKKTFTELINFPPK